MAQKQNQINEAASSIAEIMTILDSQKNQLQKLTKDLKRSQSSRTTENPEEHDQQNQDWKNDVLKLCQNLEAKVSKKVDHDVLEELVKHLATRDELKKLARKKLGGQVYLKMLEEIVEQKILQESNQRLQKKSKENTQTSRSSELEELEMNLRREIKDYLKAKAERLEATLLKRLDAKLQESDLLRADDEIPRKEANMESLKDWFKIYSKEMLTENLRELETRFMNSKKELAHFVKQHVKKLSEDKENATFTNEDLVLVTNKLTREFDEKMFLLCTDLSECKSQLANHFAQPFYRCAQWIWKSGSLKQGTAVPWNIQSLNTGTKIPYLDNIFL